LDISKSHMQHSIGMCGSHNYCSMIYVNMFGFSKDLRHM
jgi:hypothetical protein